MRLGKGGTDQGISLSFIKQALGYFFGGHTVRRGSPKNGIGFLTRNTIRGYYSAEVMKTSNCDPLQLPNCKLLSRTLRVSMVPPRLGQAKHGSKVPPVA